jgi:hypothetical protein
MGLVHTGHSAGIQKQIGGFSPEFIVFLPSGISLASVTNYAGMTSESLAFLVFMELGGHALGRGGTQAQRPSTIKLVPESAQESECLSAWNLRGLGTQLRANLGHPIAAETPECRRGGLARLGLP